MKKEFVRKIARNGGIYDTKNYRYVIRDDGIYRININYLDTAAVYGGWKKVSE